MSESHERLLDALRRMACAAAEQEGVELVDLAVRGSSRKRTVRVNIDRAGPRGVDVDDCHRVSVALGRALDEDELLENRYNLEVSSPGIDRPIRSDDDVRRNTGRAVVVMTIEPVAGAQRHCGVLLGGDSTHWTLKTETEERLNIPRETIETAQQDAGF